jgi:elongation factor P
MTLRLDDKLWQVVENAPQARQGQAVVRTKLKQVETGKVIDRTFRAGEDVEQAIVQRKTLQFLYREGEDYVLMDTESYEQRHVSPEIIGDRPVDPRGRRDQHPGVRGRIIGIELPASVVLEVTHTEPGLAGDTATNTTKPATLETGVEVQVPLFITIGEKIKVDTRTGDYISRA